MPLAPVSDDGIQLYYEDSGAPPDRTAYTTLVLLHGTGFHGGKLFSPNTTIRGVDASERPAIFRRLIPLASTSGLRVILANRRDYPGSTPFSERDRALIAPGSSEEDGELFLWERALELVRFLVRFIRESDIPSIRTSDSGECEGGLSVIAWSSSNTILMSLMGNLARVPDDLRDALEPYMRSYIHYDGPHWALGYPDSEYITLVHPLMDTTLNEEEKFEQFKHWVSAYYDHPDIASRSPSGLTESIAPESTSTTDRMNAEDSAATSSYDALVRSERFIRALPPNVLSRNRDRALFQYDPEHIVSLDLWPKVPVKMLQCQRSLWEMIRAMWETEDTYKANLMEKRPVRQMEFHMLEGCNHFAHWDNPEKFIERVAEIA